MRAGEEGRACAVVAGEVRSFAQRSVAAARDIEELIEHGLSDVYGAGQPETLKQTFARTFERPLRPKQPTYALAIMSIDPPP